LDVTVASTLAASYVDVTGIVAELAASRKSAKYANLQQSHTVQPLAVENVGFVNESCRILKPRTEP